MNVSVKEARLLEGKPLALEIQEKIKRFVEEVRSKRMDLPSFVALQAGDDPESARYINQQEKLATKLGIMFQKISSISSQKLLEERIDQFSHEEKIHGIFVAMPLPKGFDVDEALLVLNPHKDIEGIHPATLGLLVLRKAKLIPPTAYAVLKLIEQAVQESGQNLRGLKAAIIGQSAIVGRPIQLLLGERRVTVTVCNTGTSAADLEKAVSEVDIVVACAGQPGIVKGKWIKPGAIVIDIGTTEVNGRLVGDVEFAEAKKRAGFLTPVPGGVGPLTVTMLMENLIHAYRWQKEST